jgi:hypothetical protein
MLQPRSSLLASLLLISACTTVEGEASIGKPLGYARDRCYGAHNQCQTDCASIDDDGPARSACMQRCLTLEDRCYAIGDDGAALSVGGAIGEARTREEKEADFQRWKAQRQRERESAEKKEAEPQ